MSWPPTTDEVVAWLRIPAADPTSITLALAAAVDKMQTERPDLFPPGTDPTTVDPGGAFHLGTVMHAGRMYTRAVNTSGVDPVTGLGIPPVAAIDVDVANLCGLRSYRRPAVG